MNILNDYIYPWLLTSGIKIILIAIGTYILLLVLSRIVHHTMDHVVKKTYDKRSEAAFEKRKQTLDSVTTATLKVVIWIAAGLMILSEIGVDIAPLIAGAGIIGLAFGFGGQYLVRDVIAGLFIIVEDQIRKGDVVRIAGIAGAVDDINLRRTILRDLDGVEHHIPNGEITITSNMTKFWSRIHLNIGVAYESDLKKVRDVLNTICTDFAEDPEWKNDIKKIPEVVGVEELGDSAITIKILGDTRPGRQWDAMRELRLRIKEVFDKEKIEIPFPQNVVTLKK